MDEPKIIVIGIISSVINMAAPTPKGTEIKRANSELIGDFCLHLSNQHDHNTKAGRINEQRSA